MIKIIKEYYNNVKIKGVNYNNIITFDRENEKKDNNELINVASRNSSIVNKFMSCIPNTKDAQLITRNGIVVIEITVSKSDARKIIRKLSKIFGYDSIKISTNGFENLGVIIDDETYIEYNSYGENELALYLENDLIHPNPA